MVTMFLTPRVLRSRGDNAQRTIAVTRRNVILARHAGYWWVLVSGFFEPVLYLGSIGVGVGGLIGDVTLAPTAVRFPTRRSSHRQCSRPPR